VARSDNWRWLGLALGSLALVGCAAIGGLGDFKEVDCVGSCGEDAGPDGGVSSGDAAPDGAQGDAGADASSQPFGSIGGTVSGLVGTGLVLKDNGGDDLQIATNGPYTFPAVVKTGNPYAVTVGSQPTSPTQVCTVANGSGTVQGADVTNADVTCATSAYNVGGTVVGLSSGSVVLTNNGGDDKTVSANGAFTFATKVASGSPYAVAVKSGACSVSGGSGTVGVADVTSVVVNCAPGTYTIGGTVSGLNGTVVLQDNGGNDLTLTGNGSFAFSQTLADTAAYAVTVKTQPGYPPRAQTCAISGGTGNVAGANVTTVSVTCTTNTYSIGGSVTGLSGTLVLKDNGGDDLTLGASGGFTFATKVASGSTYAVTVGTQPSGQTCTVSSGSGTVANANVTGVSVSCVSGGDPGILCGATYCNPAIGELCCVTSGVAACTTKCTGANTTPYKCDDAADCQTGLVCCGAVSGTTVNNIYCTGPSLCQMGSGKAFYCDPNASNNCPNGGTCQATNTPPGYYRCF
jgi:hypothetical protein